MEIYSEADILNGVRWPEESETLADKLERCRNVLKYNARWIDENKKWQINKEAGFDAISMGERGVKINIDYRSLTISSDYSLIDNIKIYDVDGKVERIETSLHVPVYSLQLSSINIGMHIVEIKFTDSDKKIYKKIFLK